jgi:hypothetical protein
LILPRISSITPSASRTSSESVNYAAALCLETQGLTSTASTSDTLAAWSRFGGRPPTLLSEDERARLDQLVLAKTRREYVTARSLVRMTLSRYADVDPRSWTFRANAWGRPEISPPCELRFNVSHASRAAARHATRTISQLFHRTHVGKIAHPRSPNRKHHA